MTSAEGGEATPEAVDPWRYRQAIGRFATGVAVVTTTAGGHDHAMTVNSVTSVSLDPVLVLVCAEVDGRWLEAVEEAGVWGLSVLPAQSRGTAEWLSSPGRPLHGQLDRVPYHRGEHTGVALLDGALAALECRTEAIHPAGDHGIVVGRVLSVHTPERAGAALVHFRGRYGVLP